MRPPRLVIAVLSALSFTLPATASADPQWRGAVNGPATSSDAAQVAFDGAGNAVAVWRKSSPTGGDSVWTAIAPAGSVAFGNTKRISAAPGSGETPEVSELTLAVDSEGNAVAAWVGSYTAGATPLISIARRSSGVWDAPQLISDAESTAPTVAFGTAGTATVAWSQVSSDYLQVRIASVPTAGTTVTAVQTIAPGSAYAMSPHLAFDANGNGFVMWSEMKVGYTLSATATITLRAMGRKANESTFTGSQMIYSSTTLGVSHAELAMDRGGNATVAWGTSSQEDGSPADVYAATRLLGGTGWPGVKLSSGKAGSPDVAASNGGGAIVTWVEQPADGSTTDEDSGTIKAARRAPATTSFMSPVRVSAYGELGREPDVAAGTGGTSVISWIHPSASGDTPRASVLAPGSENWWAADDLDLAGGSLSAPTAAVSPTNDAIFMWQPATGYQRVNRLDGASVSSAPTPEPDPAPTTPPATTPSNPGTPSSTTPSSTTPGSPTTGTPSTGTPSSTTPGSPTTGTPSTGTPSNPSNPGSVTPVGTTPATSSVGKPVTSVPGGSVSASVTVAAGPAAQVVKTTPPAVKEAQLGPLPSLRSFKALTAKRFRAADAGDGLVRRGDGISLAFTGNYAGTLRLVVTSVPKNGRAKNLTPAVSAPVVAGTTRLVFTGRLAGKALPAGDYRLKALFVDSSGRASNLRVLSIIIKK